MKKSSRVYHVFLFLSTLTRGLVEIFSLVFLYQKGFSLHEILFFLAIMYAMGILVNYVSLKFPSKIILILSSLLYGVSFLYLSYLKDDLVSLLLFAFLLASSTYSNHAIRHLLALELLDHQKKSTNYVAFTIYLATIVASIVGIYLIDKLPFFITSILVFVLSFLSILPIWNLSLQRRKRKFFVRRVKLDKNKILFSILEQFKVIFLELQPLFLYLYIHRSISYVGIFNIIVNIASFLVICFLANRISRKYFRYFNILLGVILFLKLNIQSGILLFGLAFLEGIFVKIYEVVSLGNLYEVENNPIASYLLIEELIFFTSKTMMMFVFYFLRLDLKIIMYLCIIGLVASGFFIKEGME